MYLSIYVSTKRIVLSPGPCLNMEHDLGCGRQGGEAGGREEEAGRRQEGAGDCFITSPGPAVDRAGLAVRRTDQPSIVTASVSASVSASV